MFEQDEISFIRTARTGDAIRVRVTIDRGQVLAFTVQLEVFVDGQFRPAERYDSAHGQAHRDTLNWSGQTITKTRLPPTISMNDAFTHAENDLLEDAATYREAFLERARKDSR
jgi:hypothetical protein